MSGPSDMSIFYDRFDINEASLENVLSSSEQQQQLRFSNNEEILKYVLSQPDLASQILRQLNELNLTSPTGSPQQQQPSQVIKSETEYNRI